MTCDAWGDWMELREAKLLQIIREMFGGMENCLYLCKRILFDVSKNSSTAMTIIHSDESQNIEFKESWNDKYLQWICGFANEQGGISILLG